MHKLTTGLLTLALLAAVAPLSVAQPPEGGGEARGPRGPGGPGGPGFRGPMGFDKLGLISQKQVQDELKLSEKQIKQIEIRRDKQRESFREMRELAPEERDKKIAKSAKSIDSTLSKLLTSAQYKRLNQIFVQQRGTRALTDPEVVKTLALTAGQKKKIEQFHQEALDEMRNSFVAMGGFNRRGPGGPGGPGAGGPGAVGPGGPPQNLQNPAAPQQQPNGPPNDAPGPPRGPEGGPRERQPLTPEQQAAREESMKKLEALRTSTDEKVLEVLTEKQLAKWQEMQGEEFKLVMGPPPGMRDGERRNRPDAKGDAQADAKGEAKSKPVELKPAP